MRKPIISASAVAFLIAAIPEIAALGAPHLLTNGPGDGTVSVGVDGYASFGSSVGSQTTDAFYDAVGPIGTSATSFESAVAIRFNNTGPRQFLTTGDIGGSGGLGLIPVLGSATSGSSSFSYNGLNFAVTQTVVDLVSSGNQVGSRLDQTFVISNPGRTAASFEMMRYLDGDLYFDGSLVDGGGRMFLNGTEILFETDSATGAADPTTFVGITSEGGTIPASGRYEIDSFSGLRQRIINGTQLDDFITGDSGDADQFIDANQGYDVTLALRNLFVINPGGSATYVTRTIFGSGSPDETPPPPPIVPETNTIVAGGAVALLALKVWRGRRTSPQA
ncbi:MAG: hypothetical protein JNK85_14500 [Verrucomicrobiales bacterium]|nr:hypothetical protein [Verrucomicrobiales bacterium]